MKCEKKWFYIAKLHRTAQPLKWENEWVVSYINLMDVGPLIHIRINVKPCYLKGAPEDDR